MLYQKDIIQKPQKIPPLIDLGFWIGMVIGHRFNMSYTYGLLPYKATWVCDNENDHPLGMGDRI